LSDGQKIAKYKIEAQVDGQWRVITQGQTVGHRRIDQVQPMTATAIRLTCTESVARPVMLRSLAAYNTETAPK
jgi:alpha-L-fucosidase